MVYFSYFALKHRLWVLVRIASRFIVLSKNIKDVKKFPMNFSIFTSEKICILYEQVFVSISIFTQVTRCCANEKKNVKSKYFLCLIAPYLLHKLTHNTYTHGITSFKLLYLSRQVGKPTICIGENKDADQLRGNHEADQRLCFRYSDSTIPLLLKSEISSF